MTEKTRTIVVIESHQQTIIRRSRRTITAQVVTSPPEPVQAKRKLLGRWWKTVALKSTTVLAPLARRLKRGGKVEKMKTLKTSGPRLGPRAESSLDRD